MCFFLDQFYLFIFKDFIYLFLEREAGREKDKERNINVWLPLARPALGTWPTTQACALTGNRTSDPLVCRLVLSPLSCTSRGIDQFYCIQRTNSWFHWLYFFPFSFCLISIHCFFFYIHLICFDFTRYLIFTQFKIFSKFPCNSFLGPFSIVLALLILLCTPTFFFCTFIHSTNIYWSPTVGY